MRCPPKSCQMLPTRPNRAPCRLTTKTLAPEKLKLSGSAGSGAAARALFEPSEAPGGRLPSSGWC